MDNLIIYEEGGADATFDSGQIAGSPFDPAQVNAKTGYWGVLVAKTAFTAGKFYLALWEMTVDSITTAKIERYFACNASQFKADVSVVDTVNAKLGAFSGAAGDEVKTQLTNIVSAILLGDISTQVVYATSQDATRKVAIGEMDRVKFLVKARTAGDWSSPIYPEMTVYCWYQNLGDSIPYMYGAAS